MAASSTVIPIPPTDPFSAFLVSRAEPVDLPDLELESEVLDRLRAEGIVLVVPLVSEGRLLGTVNLGPRKSEQDYTNDDRSLLSTLASQLAPAVRLASLAKQQEDEAAERERIEQELRVARIIQQTLLPKNLPEVSGWEVSAHYQPAREVGGDFYDVLETGDGRLVIIEGDVTDKGVPAALVMATCRAALRSAVELTSDPGEILSRTNNALVDDIPPTMFVTCFVGVVEPSSGRIRFANAGHPVPAVAGPGGASELRASGMPLGLIKDSPYEVVEAELVPDSVMVVASDGVAEAHGHDGSMYGFDRVLETVTAGRDGDPIDALLEDIDGFAAFQEDDITVVSLRRLASAAQSAEAFGSPLLEFEVPSQEGAERAAMEKVVAAAGELGLDEPRAAKLGTAVAEAVMNAAEHGNGFDSGIPVGIVLHERGDSVVVEVSDDGGGLDGDLVAPDLEAKLDGAQSPRGWGRFLIEKLVDETTDRRENGRHILEMRMRKVGP